MIVRLLDKLIFAFALLLALQIPQLADHYHQFLSGYHESTKEQVDGYKATALLHEYADVYTMVEEHLINDNASIRTDAQQKLDTMNQYDRLTETLSLFDHGNLLEKTIYMLDPAQFSTLEKTLDNFRPGLPLSVQGLGFGVILGLVLSFVINLPFLLISTWLRRRHKFQQQGQLSSIRMG